MNVTEQLCVTVFWVLLRHANSKFRGWVYLLSKNLLKKLLFDSVFKMPFKAGDTSCLFISVTWVPLSYAKVVEYFRKTKSDFKNDFFFLIRVLVLD